MTNTEEWLRQVTGEPTPEPEGRVSTFDMCDAITYKARTSQYNDPQLQPQLLQRTLQRLRQAADDGTPEVSGFARWVLEDLWHRAESGVPYGELEDAEQDLWPERAPFIRRVTDVVDDL